MKFNRSCIIIYSCALIACCLLFTASGKANYVQIELCMFMIKAAIIGFGIVYCMKDE